MLESLHIENVAVAKNVNIDFSNGFNVLTGETGAGKSIIIDSINLILGAKTSKEIVRYGCEKAIVNALFSAIPTEVFSLCDEYGIDYDESDLFSITRVIAQDGKSTVKINGKTASLAQLKSISQYLVNIHGQNENHSFMDKSNHIAMLDDYIENDLSEYKKLFSCLNSIKSEISELFEMSKQKEMMTDILNYQINEINSAKLKNHDEEDILISQKNRLKEAEKITKLSMNAYKALVKNESGISAVYLLEKAIDALNKLSEIQESAKENAEKLQSFKYEIMDIAERSAEYASFGGIKKPEKELQSIEARLALLQRLKRKYGSTVAEIIKFKDQAQEKLDNLEAGDQKLAELKNEYKKIYQKAMQIADIFHNKRIEGSKELSLKIKSSLEFLDMPKVLFEISVNKNINNGNIVLTSCGYDDVEFMIATNVGEELSSMNKIASGGELSRIMLALKSILSDKKGAQTVIFDEIDTGVSGSTSQKIGIKLCDIAKGTQTICVTHSAQIASLAENHYLIKKAEIDERAEAKVFLLDKDDRIKEIARIIGGINVTDKQFAAATELINQAERIKKSDV